MTERPKTLLTSNSELREDGIMNWTLPAFAVKLDDGRNINVCPQAGACATVCYARNGTYLFSNVIGKHKKNLAFILDDLEGWKQAMLLELGKKKMRPSGEPRSVQGVDPELTDPFIRQWLDTGGKTVRIHDSGDFFSDEYTIAWMEIAEQVPDVLFYAYTKEVTRFRTIVEGKAPVNFRWLYSMGGKEDYLVKLEEERHADVFLSWDSMVEAGYVDQSASDLQAILLPSVKIGIPANNIPHFKKKMDGKTFGDLQRERDDKKSIKLGMT
jgi:hypothetical protein